jgi:hypothetical protein
MKHENAENMRKMKKAGKENEKMRDIIPMINTISIFTKLAKPADNHIVLTFLNTTPCVVPVLKKLNHNIFIKILQNVKNFKILKLYIFKFGPSPKSKT